MPSFTPQEEEREERLAIMEFDGKMTRAEAQKLYEQTTKEKMASAHYEDKIKRIRELDTMRKMSKKKNLITGKSMAAGEKN